MRTDTIDRVTTGTSHDTEALVHQAGILRDRAHSLRAQAAQLSPVLATTYRRRAAELELEAWVLEVSAGV